MTNNKDNNNKDNNNKAETLKKQLFMKKANCWDLQSKDQDKIFEFAEGYKKALDYGKTERRFIYYTVEQLKFAGFKHLSEFEKLEQGNKVYVTLHDKTLIAALIGAEKEPKRV